MEQNLFVGLYKIDGTLYKELNAPDYKRMPFGRIGWSIHPQIFGVINAENIIFEKPTTSDWGIVSALAMFDSIEGYGMVSIMPIDHIEAKAGNAVVIEQGGIFVPIKMIDQIQATVNSYVIH